MYGPPAGVAGLAEVTGALAGAALAVTVSVRTSVTVTADVTVAGPAACGAEHPLTTTMAKNPAEYRFIRPIFAMVSDSRFLLDKHGIPLALVRSRLVSDRRLSGRVGGG